MTTIDLDSGSQAEMRQDGQDDARATPHTAYGNVPPLATRDEPLATDSGMTGAQEIGPIRDALTALHGQAARHPHRVALRYLADGDHEGVVHTLTYAALVREARQLARLLMRHAEPGARVVLMLPSGIRYAVAFFACQYARMIAVPAYPPEGRDMRMSAHVQRLRRIVADCDARIVMLPAHATQDATEGSRDSVFSGAGLLDATPLGDDLAMLATVALEVLPSGTLHATSLGPSVNPSTGTLATHAMPDAICFLQYTSGSTASPKGVMVSHANLLANVAALAYAWQCTEADRMFSWLPLYHDMGLIGGLLLPILHGFPVTLISPAHFLERPSRWLRGIAAERATVSGGPDFAFRLCIDRMRHRAIDGGGDSRIDGPDLRGWRLAFCGSEPIRQSTMDGFATHFAPYGFASTSLYPCYGLAEATLIVSGGVAGTGASPAWFSVQALRETPARGVSVNGSVAQGEGGSAAKTIVGCGSVVPYHEMAIVGDDGQRVPDGEVGEIWCSGPSIAQGYWRNPAASDAAFVRPAFAPDARWLRTGDLGFVDAGQVFLCGRRKDILIVRGENVYPQDLEALLADRVPGLRRGRISVFPVPMPEASDAGLEESSEGIGIAAEVPRGKARHAAIDTLVGDIAAALGEAYQYRSDVVLLLEPGDLPRTSSGKLQRGACYAAWRDGTLVPYAVYDRRGSPPATSSSSDTSQTSTGATTVARASSTGAPPPRERETGWSATARLIADVWHDVLGRDNEGDALAVDAAVARDDQATVENRHAREVPALRPDSDFFAMGGRSLLATRVAARLRAVTERPVPVGMLFRYPVLRDLAAALDHAWSVEDIETTKGIANEHDARQAVSPETPHAAVGHGAMVSSHDATSPPLQTAPLSLQQQRLWVLWQMDPDSSAYNVSATVTIDGAVSTAGLQDAVEAVIRRHDALRTRFVTDEDDCPLQQILPPHAVAQAWDWREVVGVSETLGGTLRDAARVPFDLNAGPLLRVIHHVLGATRHVVQFVLHHIVTDGWSIDLMLREWAQAVRAPAMYAALAPLPISYPDYAVMQRAQVGGAGRAEYDRQRDYWRRRLQAVPAVWPLAPDIPGNGDHISAPVHSPSCDKATSDGLAGDSRADVATDALFGAARLTLAMPSALTRAIDDLARKQAVTRFSVCLAALDALLYRDAGHRDLTIAVPVAGRDDPRLETAIGFFVNTLVVRSTVDGAQPFTTLLRSVHHDSLQAQAHGAVPFDRVVADVRRDALASRKDARALDSDRADRAGDDTHRANGAAGVAAASGMNNMSHGRAADIAMPPDHPLANPFTQIKLVLHDALPRTLVLGERMDGTGAPLTGKVSNADASDARFAIALDLVPTDAGGQPAIEAVFAYAPTLYSAARMARFAADYQTLLTRVSRAPETVLDAL